MARHDEQDDEAELDDREDPDPEDADWNLDPAEVPCPSCKREISEDAPRCPYCGCYGSEEDRPSRRSWWWIAAIVLLVLLLIGYLLH